MYALISECTDVKKENNIHFISHIAMTPYSFRGIRMLVEFKNFRYYSPITNWDLHMPLPKGPWFSLPSSNCAWYPHLPNPSLCQQPAWYIPFLNMGGDQGEGRNRGARRSGNGSVEVGNGSMEVTSFLKPGLKQYKACSQRNQHQKARQHL
jgi:hypothetical protein